MSYAAGPKARGALINEDNGEEMPFMFNPRQLTAQLQVNWDKSAALGASFERLGYRNTSNVIFNLNLLHNLVAWISRNRAPGRLITGATAANIRSSFDQHRRFLIALCYPQGRYNDVMRRSPPTALFIWPGYVAMRLVITSLQFTDTEFDENSLPTVFDAACVFEEHRTYRLTSADAWRKGFLRVE